MVLWLMLLSIPADNLCYLYPAMFLSEHNRHDEALTLWQKASQIDATDFDVIFNLASAHRQVGNNREAVKFYEKAVSISPQVIISLLLLQLSDRLREPNTNTVTLTSNK